MEDLITTISDFVQSQQLLNVVRAILIVVGGFISARLVSSLLVRSTKAALDAHQLMIPFCWVQLVS